MRGRGLVENEMIDGKIHLDEVDRDSEINEMHGLAHLQASDEELY